MDSDKRWTEDDMPPLSIPCLSSGHKIPTICNRSKVKLDEYSAYYLVKHILFKLGPGITQKILQQLNRDSVIEWDEEEAFEVEGIIDYGLGDDQETLYCVKWRNWDHRHNTWEPIENLSTCGNILKHFRDNVARGWSSADFKRHLASQEKDPESTKSRILDMLDRVKDLRVLSPQVVYQASLCTTQEDTRPQTVRERKKVISALDAPVRNKLPRSSVNKKSVAYKKLKAEALQALKNWESELNRINTDPAPLFVENDIDLEGPPENFTYITDYVYKDLGVDVQINADPICGCECEDCFANQNQCCAANMGVDFAYYKTKKVKVAQGRPIYECNKICPCGPECPNRVVQRGRKYKICIFRTKDRGWGVKTLQKVKAGAFVLEYSGEVITHEEAERRGKEYDASMHTYLFDLDYNDLNNDDGTANERQNWFTVDAAYYGNASHFINHSCDPNLSIYNVWIDNLDTRLPRIALFAIRDIDKGEELTFDYHMTGDTTNMPEGETTDTEGSILNSETEDDDALTSHKRPPDVNTSQLEGEFKPAKVPRLDLSQESQELTPPSTPESIIVLDDDSVSGERGSGDRVVAAKQQELNGQRNIDSEKNSLVQNSVKNSPMKKVNRKIMRCQCGSKNCRGWLY